MPRMSYFGLTLLWRSRVPERHHPVPGTDT
jgi:hypothetical protein